MELLILGIFIILSALGFAIYWAAGNHPHKAWVIPLCIVVIIVGMFFTLHDRAIEITFKGVGTIKAAAEQATIDANTIAEIKNRIEAQSATVDLVAQSASEAKNQLTELKSITDFSKTVIAAQNDDRYAFNQLLLWLDDKSFPFQKEAANAVILIRANYGGPIIPGHMNFPWPKGLDNTKLNIEQLKKIYKDSAEIYHTDLVEFITTNSTFSRKDKMAFCIEVLNDDKSLLATSYAGKFFSKEANIEWKHFIVKPLLDWWKENKDKIE